MAKQFSSQSPKVVIAVISLISFLVSAAPASQKITEPPLVAKAEPLFAAYVVNTLGDAADINVGDGRCDTDAGVGGDQCTLRGAIQEVNVGGTKEIDFSLPPNSIITLDSALPDISGTISIIGTGSNTLTVQRSAAASTPNFRIFTFFSNVAVNSTISGLTVTNGRVADGGTSSDGQFGSNGVSGGGILNPTNETLTLIDLVVSGNRAGNGGAGTGFGGSGGTGGGILNSGKLVLMNSVVTNNRAGNGGAGGSGASGGNAGGVTGGVSLIIINSTISNNFAGDGGNAGPGSSGGPGGRGGGIGAGGGTFTILGSTISGNRSGKGGNGGGFSGAQGGDGGGILTQGPLNMVNSTVSNNITGDGGSGTRDGGLGGYGGAIYNQNFLNITNCTIAENQTQGFFPGLGGGIYNFTGGTVTLKNTLIADNTVPAGGSGPDLSGTFNSQDYNLIKNTSGATINGVTTHNLTGVNPQIGPLANNGGLTQTHGLLSGSPALDAGNNASLPADEFDLDNDGNKTEPVPFDQRGATFSRVVNGTVDIGAVEEPTGSAPMQLLLDTSGPAANQVAALDSLIFFRDPFPVFNSGNFLNTSPDKNTRVIIFVRNLQLSPGEPASSVVVSLTDGNNQSTDIVADDVRPCPGVDFSQVTFRLPNSLPAGTYLLAVKWHAQLSNSGSVRIK
jgi:CSLREA domain-containing protein